MFHLLLALALVLPTRSFAQDCGPTCATATDLSAALSGTTAATDAAALAAARKILDPLVTDGILSVADANALAADLAALDALQKAIAAIEALLKGQKWDSAKSEAHNAAEDLRKKVKSGALTADKANPLIDLMQKLWGVADAKAKAAKHSPVPSGSRVNSGYGWRIHPVYGTKKFHTGVDVPLNRGTDLYATGSGHIEDAGWAGGYGNQISVRLDDGSLVTYSHCKDLAGHKAGDKVKAGDVVAHVNSTGTSTGNHLHLEVYDAKGTRQDPKKWFGL